jgi:putative ABC transport system substrate-binding protein
VCLLATVLLLVASAFIADAQQTGRKWRVEVLTNTRLDSSFDGFSEGLRALGYVEGQNLTIHISSSDRFETLPGLAAELVGRKPDVIVTFASNALEGARKATPTIPIVALRIAEPGRYVASLARPGGNIWRGQLDHGARRQTT